MKVFSSYLILLSVALAMLSCIPKRSGPLSKEGHTIFVLGIAQDAGYPQAGCQKNCCTPYWNGQRTKRHVTSLGIRDNLSGDFWIIDATPDFVSQLAAMQAHCPGQLKGIFLTHAHIGHYTGLMHLGREAMGAQDIPVYTMPRMKAFLEQNGPWDQLVNLGNIKLIAISDSTDVALSNGLDVMPFTVPHRDEYSETVGFSIRGNKYSAVFIPDIDKWTRWHMDVKDVVASHDISFLDGTFFRNGEIPGRDMNAIPHPFIEESMPLFRDMEPSLKARIHFIHLNHTNPALFESEAQEDIAQEGLRLAHEGQEFDL